MDSLLSLLSRLIARHQVAPLAIIPLVSQGPSSNTYNTLLMILMSCRRQMSASPFEVDVPVRACAFSQKLSVKDKPSRPPFHRNLMDATVLLDVNITWQILEISGDLSKL